MDDMKKVRVYRVTVSDQAGKALVSVLCPGQSLEHVETFCAPLPAGGNVDIQHLGWSDIHAEPQKGGGLVYQVVADDFGDNAALVTGEEVRHFRPDCPAGKTAAERALFVINQAVVTFLDDYYAAERAAAIAARVDALEKELETFKTELKTLQALAEKARARR